MRGLIDSKQLPRIVIPAAEFGRVPLEAISVSDERSVSARLESLEASVKSVVSAVEKFLSPVLLPFQECPSHLHQAVQARPLLTLQVGSCNIDLDSKGYLVHK